MRRTGHRQLSFAFADSPQGDGEAGTSDASGGRAFLLHTAKPKRTARTVAGTADTSRLLEEVASAANLAQALLKVIRNQGAPGVDGQTNPKSRMRGPHVRFCERRREAILCAYSTRPSLPPTSFHASGRRTKPAQADQIPLTPITVSMGI